MTSTLDRFKRATSRLDELIERTPAQEDSSREAVRARAEYRMTRLRRFLRQLGDPHIGYPIVHIGGTSGKGSTSTAVASILRSAGYRTGLHTSPYLQVPTEKLQLDGQLISADTFATLTDHLLTEHDRWLRQGEEALTYGEAWNALMALFFQDQRVDIAVVEVGAGGRFDLTNILKPVLSAVTSVGIDHTNTLGSTIEDIAWHKAGIIKSGIPSISAVLPQAARQIIRQEAKDVGSDLKEIDATRDISEIEVAADRTSWTEVKTDQRYAIGLAGSFQAVNGYLAVTIARVLRSNGMAIRDDDVYAGLRVTSIPGRAESILDRVPILLDGAHNQDKITALAADLPALLPIMQGGSRIGVVGALEAKQADAMLSILTPHLDTMVATSPKVLAKAGREAGALGDAAQRAGFTGSVIIEPEPRRAIEHALRLAHKERGDAILVTGSLYLVGNIREQWYRGDDIVLAQSSWPRIASPTSIPEAV